MIQGGKGGGQGRSRRGSRKVKAGAKTGMSHLLTVPYFLPISTPGLSFNGGHSLNFYAFSGNCEKLTFSLFQIHTT